MAKLQKTEARTEFHNDTRDRLLIAGTEILSEKGFFSTRLEEVLQTAGVPKGSFYYHFDSKTSFGLVVVENYKKIWAQKARLFDDQTVPPRERIHNYITEGVRGLEKYAFHRGCLIGNIGQEMSILEEQFRERIVRVFASCADKIAKCLAEAKQQKDLPDDLDTTEVSRSFWFAWEGPILQAKLECSTTPIELSRSVFFNTILHRPTGSR